VSCTKVGVEASKGAPLRPCVIDLTRADTVDDQKARRMRLTLELSRLRCPLTPFHIAPQLGFNAG
jgi:hypothetical protein